MDVWSTHEADESNQTELCVDGSLSEHKRFILQSKQNQQN